VSPISGITLLPMQCVQRPQPDNESVWVRRLRCAASTVGSASALNRSLLIVSKTRTSGAILQILANDQIV